ncbi:MAG: flagellar export chaperone FliS [Deltaproteobacteria bacterium]|nr:flagellar export chaperone FliS [Deltaproteobacteria bacterium]
MYRRGDGTSAYKQTSVTTADPKRLVLMCYEGAISNLKTAKEKYGSGDYEAKAKAFKKVFDILDALMQSLDFKRGGEIAKNLDALYSYMYRRLLAADLRKDTAAIDEIIHLLDELKSTWEEISSVPRPDHPRDSHHIGQTAETVEPTRITGAY